jgi:hypothetical protein
MSAANCMSTTLLFCDFERYVGVAFVSHLVRNQRRKHLHPSRQLHLQLFALTVTDQRQIHYFAGLGLVERFYEVVDVTGLYQRR